MTTLQVSGPAQWDLGSFYVEFACSGRLSYGTLCGEEGAGVPDLPSYL